MCKIHAPGSQKHSCMYGETFPQLLAPEISNILRGRSMISFTHETLIDEKADNEPCGSVSRTELRPSATEEMAKKGFLELAADDGKGLPAAESPTPG
uniref:Uncharacterized protein n=1 Tax=Steinernema glaseri TaxID=37863 RepID=A0A1I7ZUL5_9BILA